MIRKTIAGIILAVALFAGVGHVQEFVYCRGLIQGQIDGFSAFFGPLDPEKQTPAFYASLDNALNSCYSNPNDPGDYRPPFGLFFGGNIFDSTLDVVKSWLP